MVKNLCIIPAYNEEKNIDKLLKIVCSYDWDVLVINAGSTDSTEQIIKSYLPKVKHITIETNSLSAALIKGFNFAIYHSYEYCCTCDGDGEYFPGEIFKLLNNSKHYDLVIGDRFSNKVIPIKNIPLIKYIEKKYKFSIKDPKSGARVYKVSSLQKVDFSKIISTNYGLSLELSMKFLELNMKLLVVPFINYKKTRERVLKNCESKNIEAEDLCKIIGNGNKIEGKNIISLLCYEMGISYFEWESYFATGTEVVISK